MAMVSPKQPKKERDQITIRLHRDVPQNLAHYCRHLESDRDYVINQCLAFSFRKDKPLAMCLRGQVIGATDVLNRATVQAATARPGKRKSQQAAIQVRLSIAKEVSK
jgi:hypothetical protein